ncbi:MAG: DNA-binding transcriptional regulator [Thermoguttaceae bacterium]|nr:DNA-binding transcriptional regulator [Thermoguttaceae bacterium]
MGGSMDNPFKKRGDFPKRILVFVETSRQFGRGVIEGISQYAQERGDWLIYFEDTGLNEMHRTSNFSIDHHVWDGIISRSPSYGVMMKLKSLGIPMVELKAPVENGDGVFADVGIDFATVSQWAADHFIERNLRNFAFFSMINAPWTSIRKKTFQKALERYGYKCNVFPVMKSRSGYYPYLLEKWTNKLQKRLETWLVQLPKPVGLFVASDSYANFVIQICHQAGIVIPDDVAILSCDNDPLICRTVFPPLSSIDHNCQKIGYKAGQLLHSRMMGKKVESCPQFVKPAFIAVRQSTDMIAVDDEYVIEAISFIRRNIDKSIGVRQVTDYVGVTRKTIERHFRNVLGRTPAEEILRQRMQRAKYLLQETSLTIDVIAESVGFPVTEYFLRVFRQVFGMTARQMRQQSHSSFYSAMPLGNETVSRLIP